MQASNIWNDFFSDTQAKHLLSLPAHLPEAGKQEVRFPAGEADLSGVLRSKRVQVHTRTYKEGTTLPRIFYAFDMQTARSKEHSTTKIHIKK